MTSGAAQALDFHRMFDGPQPLNQPCGVGPFEWQSLKGGEIGGGDEAQFKTDAAREALLTQGIVQQVEAIAQGILGGPRSSLWLAGG